MTHSTDVGERAGRTRERLECFERAFEGSSLGMAHADLDGRLIRVNRRLCEITGHTAEELLRQSIQDLLHSTGQPPAAEALETLTSHQMPSFFAERPFVRQDHSVVWISVTISLVHDESGQPTFFDVSINDISGRRGAQTELEAQRELMRYIIAHDPNAIAVYDNDLRFVYVSQRYLEEYGIGEREIIGKLHQEVFPEVSERRQEVHRRVLSGAVERCEDDSFVRPDGSVIYNRWECRPWYRTDGSIGGMITYTEVTTERKLAEASLRESQRVLADAERLAGLGAWSWNMRADRWEVSANWLAIHGCDRPPQTTAEVMNLVFPEDIECVQKALDRSLASEGMFEVEHRIYRKDTGELRHIRALGEVVVDRDGEPVRMRGASLDITKRKHAEEQLRLTQYSLDHSVVCAFWIGRDGQLHFVNETACQELGYDRDELLQMNIRDIVADYQDEGREGFWQEIAAAKPQIFETVHRRRDGTTFPAEVTAHYLEFGGQPYEFAVSYDITERKEAEASLRRIEWMLHPWEMKSKELDPKESRPKESRPKESRPKESRPKELHPSVGAAESKGNAAAPQAAEKGHRRSYGELVAPKRCGEILQSVGQEMLERIVRDYLDLLDTSAAVCEENGDYALGLFSSGWCRFMDEATRRRCATEDSAQATPSGHWSCHESCWDRASRVSIESGAPVDVSCGGGLRIYALPIRCGDEVIGSINFGYGDPPQDPAAIARLAEYLGVDAAELARRASGYESRPPFIIEIAKRRLAFSAHLIGQIVERRRAEREQERLHFQLVQSQKMEAVGRLAGGVAHDINNTLHLVQGYAGLLLNGIESDDPLQAHLVQIQKAVRRSATLTRQLLAFARKQMIAPERLDLNATVADMLKMLNRLIGEDIELQWKPGTGVGPVKMDPAQVEQILANLIVNARDAISGVGTVRIETGQKELDAQYCAEHIGAREGEYVTLTVSDTGEGMDAETLDRVFEPFFTRKDQEGGSGLGLSTVYGIVKQNQGYVEVESELGQGSTFRVFLPLLDEPDQPSGQPEEESMVRASRPAISQTVLLVEDEVPLLKLGQQMLQQMGYQVLIAEKPSEAIDIVHQRQGGEKIDLLLTDVIMPEMNGPELWARLESELPGLKCIYMSGYTENEIATRGELPEGVHFLQKPFTTGELNEKVREALDQL